MEGGEVSRTATELYVLSSRSAHSRRISISHAGRRGASGCVRGDGIRPERCRKMAIECLYAGTGERKRDVTQRRPYAAAVDQRRFFEFSRQRLEIARHHVHDGGPGDAEGGARPVEAVRNGRALPNCDTITWEAFRPRKWLEPNLFCHAGGVCHNLCGG